MCSQLQCHPCLRALSLSGSSSSDGSGITTSANSSGWSRNRRNMWSLILNEDKYNTHSNLHTYMHFIDRPTRHIDAYTRNARRTHRRHTYLHHACIHVSCMRTDLHHACIQTCIMHVHTMYIHTCMLTYMHHACIFKCTCTPALASCMHMHTYLPHACIYNVHTYLHHACIRMYLHTYIMHAYVCTYIPASCMHTYMHA
jgi:hypothetical protein